MGQVYDLDLKEREQSILLAIADHAHHDGTGTYPSIGLVAWKVGASYDTVHRAMKSLEKTGILIPVNRVQGRTTEYRIDLSKGKLKPPYVSDWKRNDANEPPANCGNSTSRKLRHPANCGIPQIAPRPPANCAPTSRIAVRDITKEPKNHKDKDADKLRQGLALFQVPEPLQTDAFNAALTDWVKHRIEKKKPITPTAARKQMDECISLGEQRAIAAINFSIANGWQGIFEDKAVANGNGNGTHSVTARPIWKIRSDLEAKEKALVGVRRTLGQTLNADNKWEPPLTGGEKVRVDNLKAQIQTLHLELETAPV